jgi:hypothetical protein
MASITPIGAQMYKSAKPFDSKSQYDLQFKKWHLRKNLNKNAWRFIHYRVEKRKSQGKESEVYFNNTLVPDKKVKKEISRHVLPTFQQGLSSGKDSFVFIKWVFS